MCRRTYTYLHKHIHVIIYIQINRKAIADMMNKVWARSEHDHLFLIQNWQLTVVLPKLLLFDLQQVGSISSFLFTQQRAISPEESGLNHPAQHRFFSHSLSVCSFLFFFLFCFFFLSFFLSFLNKLKLPLMVQKSQGQPLFLDEQQNFWSIIR